MLIDEADVYIKRREDDMTMNAVVGVFLRVLEYFNGLLFLTTNRIDDIDEAIVSRCIALIKFHPPDDDARRRIWQVMCEQFALDVKASLIDELVDVFASASGRSPRWTSSSAAPSSGAWTSIIYRHPPEIGRPEHETTCRKADTRRKRNRHIQKLMRWFNQLTHGIALADHCRKSASRIEG